ncbi:MULTISPECIES: SRPBCC family protein [Myxococcus]|uniref:Polyketide cyclase n=1 Tax=Myxococcus xanthus TaxID=34 RepID=A0AAE6KVD9_MYXXA|nr:MULTISPECIES: SRPBCC family protein [Myxococcus]QDE71065.1 polyketide cyclase [Myxococcus xanthus]QDE78345.1 polyketide cyclase [Myxococcus xanthus]QDE85726.1 polyketide cyclase [Myxococcus xanthus]QDE99888.1 polyketide cyclase [Myxococcus xanthus]WAM25251.1 SRPBCC family protein [Myxococcus sp. NMCA1]
MLKKILVGLAAVILLFVGFVVTRPDTFTYQRAAVLPVSADIAFALVNDFHRWTEWSPWDGLDPQAQRTYSGAESGTGAGYAWVGNDQVGEGRMTITDSKANEQVTIKLEFIKPFAATNTSTFAFSAAEGGTQVVWAMSGENNFVSKAMSLFMDMDAMIGKDFEKGLATMKDVAVADAKKHAEAEAARIAEEKARTEAAAAAPAGEGAPAVAAPAVP